MSAHTVMTGVADLTCKNANGPVTVGLAGKETMS